MQSFDDIVACCADGAEGDAPVDGSDIYTTIHLPDNASVQEYRASFPREQEKVESILSTFAVGEGTANDSTGDVSSVGLKEAQASGQFVAMSMEECSLHETNSLSLAADQASTTSTRSHFYLIQDDPETKLKSLTVSVVFIGTFDGPAYKPGDLSVELRHYSNSQEPPKTIGTKPEGLQIPNTENEIGRLVVDYELEPHTLIDGSLFVLEVTARTSTVYSVVLSGCPAWPVAKEVKRELASLLATRSELANSGEKFNTVQKELVLLERKRAIEGKLVEKSMNNGHRLETILEMKDLELDDQDEMEDGGASIVKQIHGLKNEQANSQRLLSLRSRMNKSLASDIERLTEQLDILHQRMKELGSNIKDSKAAVSKAAPAIWGEKTAALIMSQLLEPMEGGNGK